MTLNVILCALLVSSPERTVWTLPRNDWWARDVTAAIDINAWPNEMFTLNLRMTKDTFMILCSDLEPHIQRRDTNYRKAISVKHRVAITVWRLATNVEYRTLSHLFGVGVSTVGSIVRECCRVICDELTPRYVRMPTGDDFDRMLDGFETRWGFPHCAGAVDGTHIPIIAPTTDHCDYFNRKGWHSLIMQAVVDDRYMFIDINIGWPGSVHDARVLANSRLYQRAEGGSCFPLKKRDINGVETTPVIIGDAAYPLLNWLLKPYRETTSSTDEEKHFNYRLSRARMVVENAFGRLKGRFRILMKRNDCDIETTLTMVAACVVLHNICEMSGDAYDEEWSTDVDTSLNDDNGRQGPLGQTPASLVRDAFKTHLVNHPLV